MEHPDVALAYDLLNRMTNMVDGIGLRTAELAYHRGQIKSKFAHYGKKLSKILATSNFV